MGERDHFITMEMAAIGMEMMAGGATTPIVERLSMLTGKLADGLGNLDVGLLDNKVRAPHILCVSFPKGMAPDLPQEARRREASTPPRASAACASARTSTTTSRTSNASSRCSARSRSRGSP